MTVSALTILVVCLVVGTAVIMLLWAYGTANRLDRLHVRTDLAWQALDAALARRAVVVRTLAGEHAPRGGGELIALAGAAEQAERDDRERAENALTAALSAVDVAALPSRLAAELADAEARVQIARRFHNDAVRDTLALRTRRLVRVLHLGGTAPVPRYFEIAEGHASVPAPAATAGSRVSARVVLCADDGATLLLHGRDPKNPEHTFWFTVGGGVEDGEELRATALREVREETGLEAAPSRLIGPVWRRRANFTFNGAVLDSEELFFVYRTDRFDPDAAQRTDFERTVLLEHRWCTADDIRTMLRRGEAVFPNELPDLLGEALDLSGRTGPGVPAPGAPRTVR